MTNREKPLFSPPMFPTKKISHWYCPSYDGLSEKVTGAYKGSHNRLVLAVRAAMPKDVVYCLAHTESLIGLHLCEEHRKTVIWRCIYCHHHTRDGRALGNNFLIIVISQPQYRCTVCDWRFIDKLYHLSSRCWSECQRNVDVAGMLKEKTAFSPTIDHGLAYIGGGDGTMVLDHNFFVVSLFFCLFFFNALVADLDL